MDMSLELVSQLLARRLQPEEVDWLLKDLLEAEPREGPSPFALLASHVSALLDLLQRIASTQSLDEMLPEAVEIMTTVLNADRGTLFLYDPERQELYARIAQGDEMGELRFASDQGIAGGVFTSGEPLMVENVYADARFNRDIDRQTGYTTYTLLCVPIKTRSHQIIGVVQLLNKRDGPFTESDLRLLQALTGQIAAVLHNARLYAELQRAREEQDQLLEVATALSQELHLQPLIFKIMEAVSELLVADRSTLFLYDEHTDELWSLAAQGEDVGEIRFPSHLGIAGAVFHSGETLNIPDAYADPRFNPKVDKQSGYTTRSILCMPLVNRAGAILGVTQALNKTGGPFTRADEKRLLAFSAQAVVAIENAKLFEDTLNMRNYNESVLQSLSNGVVTLNAEHQIVKGNEAAWRILRTDSEAMLGQAADVALAQNPWLLAMLQEVWKTGQVGIAMDRTLNLGAFKPVSVNATVAPLANIQKDRVGSMIVLEDLTSEKRIKSAFGRYLSNEVVDTLLASPQGLQLGGELREITFLVSDLRGFTSLSTQLRPHDIIDILNRYLERMVDVIAYYGGTVDEFQGDGILAFFGAPVRQPDDPERAVACAIAMQRVLVELNAEQHDLGLPELIMGIGLNTGEAIVGNIGSEKRAKYGAVGSAINTAYRIESYTVGGQILISPSTYERVRPWVRLRATMEVEFKGLDKPMLLYDIAGMDGAYQLSTPALVPARLRELSSPLPMTCYRIEGKTVSGIEISGAIIRLADMGAEVTLSAVATQLSPLDNLKVVLKPQPARLLPDVYAKVRTVRTLDRDTITVQVDFTSCPDAVKAFLHSEDISSHVALESS